MSSPAPENHGEHTVGIRDLSHRTSHVLNRVRAGERLVVTDRGEPIAVVIPIRRKAAAMPAVGYASSGDPHWASRTVDDMTGFGE